MLRSRTVRRGPDWARLSAPPIVIGTTLASALLGLTAAFEPVLLLLAVGLVLTVTAAYVTWKHPGPALVVLVLMLPFYPIVFGQLARLGVPVSALGYMRYWKDLIAVVLIARAASTLRADQLQSVDWTAILFLALVAVYVVLPIGPDFYVRLLGGRQLASFILIFLAARHLGLTPATGRATEVAMLAAGAIVAAIGLWNYFLPGDYATWIVSTGAFQWQAEVLGAVGPTGIVLYHTILAGHVVVRAGSIFLNPLSAAFFLLVPLGIVIGRAAGGGLQRLELAVGALCAAGLLVTVTRTAIVAVPVMIVVGLLAGRSPGRVAVWCLVGATVLYPLVDSIGLAHQLSSALDTGSVSTAGHLSALQADVAATLRHPLGTGLATGGSQGQRFEVIGAITAESWFFQVGVEVGILGAILFVALLWQLLSALWRRASTDGAAPVAALCAMSGLAVAGLFLHSFGDLQTSYPVWALAGLAASATVSPLATGRRTLSPAVDATRP
ncbi:MAG TPA: hypothetical protein VNV65_03685 [Candidatus Solibacter sp.]|nr:hypothetical protein [Candidatus Solibacter sp.]